MRSLWNGRASVRPSVRLSRHLTPAAACSAPDLLLSAVQVGHIDWQCQALSSNGVAARHSAANAGSVMLTAEGRGWTQTCYNTKYWLSDRNRASWTTHTRLASLEFFVLSVYIFLDVYVISIKSFWSSLWTYWQASCLSRELKCVDGW